MSWNRAMVAAYCAGVVDSDGTIGIKRSTYGMRKVGDRSQPSYSERVCVKQVEPHAVEILHATFGGTRYYAKASTPSSKRLHVWQITDRAAFECILALLPHLRIKKRQAENCLHLRSLKEQSKTARCAKGRGHVGGARRPSHITEQMQAAYMNAGVLNTVGAAG